MKIFYLIILILLLSGNGISDLEGAYAIKEYDDIKWIEIDKDKLYLEKNSAKKKANLYINKDKNEINAYYINIINNNTRLCIDQIKNTFSFCSIDSIGDNSKWNLIKINMSNDEENIFIIQNKLTKKYISINSLDEENLPKTLLNMDNFWENATLFQFFKIYEEHFPKLTPLLEKESIDVLIKYIDLRDKTLKRDNIKQIKKDLDNDELKYCLRSIFQNIPWVRKIFILMPNEKVKFLKSQNEIKEKIIFVNDRDLIGFDSAAIHVFQFNLWKMKKFGLSENFILMDDDYFINYPLKKEELFYEENGRIFPLMITNDYYLINENKLNIEYNDYLSYIRKNHLSSHSEEAFLFRQISSLKFIFSLFKNETKINRNIIEASFSHNAIPLKLSDIKEVYDIIYNNYLYNNETLFVLERSIFSLHFQTFILSYLINRYKRKVHEISCAFIDVKDYYKYKRKEKLFVINTSNRDYDENIFLLEKIYLENIFNITSKYELKYIEKNIHNKTNTNISKKKSNLNENEKIKQNLFNNERNKGYIWHFIYFLFDFTIVLGIIIILKSIISKIKTKIFHYNEYKNIRVIQDENEI